MILKTVRPRVIRRGALGESARLIGLAWWQTGRSDLSVDDLDGFGLEERLCETEGGSGQEREGQEED